MLHRRTSTSSRLRQISHDPQCETCGVSYDRAVPHVCDPSDIMAILREEFRAAMQEERSRIAHILRQEVACGAGHVGVLSVRRIAEAIEVME